MSEVSKALMQMFSLVFFPIIPFVMLMVFYVWWSAVTVALFSLEPTATNTTVTANLTKVVFKRIIHTIRFVLIY